MFCYSKDGHFLIKYIMAFFYLVTSFSFHYCIPV